MTGVPETHTMKTLQLAALLYVPKGEGHAPLSANGAGSATRTPRLSYLKHALESKESISSPEVRRQQGIENRRMDSTGSKL